MSDFMENLATAANGSIKIEVPRIKTIRIKDENGNEHDEVRQRLDVAEFAKIITDQIKFARDSAKRLHYFDNGVYREGADSILGELYTSILKMWGLQSKWKRSMEDDLVSFVASDANLLWERPKLEKINLLNGVYDWSLDSFEEGHNHEHLSTVQIPVKYDPTSTCPTYDEYFDSLIDVPGGIDLIHQILALLIIPYTRLQKCIVFLGGGSNGKTTCLNIMSKFIGEENISNVPLHLLEIDKFQRSCLVGKLVNIFGDLDISQLKTTSLFKALTGEDKLQIEFKNKNPFSYRPFCRLIFSSNKRVNAKDDTIGFSRRFIVIPFTRTFSRDTQKWANMQKQLYTESELSGLLNKVLLWVPRIIENGLETTNEVSELIENYVPAPNNVSEFITEYLQPEGRVSSAILYEVYRHCVAGPDEDIMKKSNFKTFMLNSFKGVKWYRSLAIKKQGTTAGFDGLSIKPEKVDEVWQKSNKKIFKAFLNTNDSSGLVN